MRVHEVTGHGGVRLHIRDTGPVEAPVLLLIHGWSQHHLSWSKQLAGPLAERFRLVAPDLRGHGASEKPMDPSAYDHSEPWARDLAAIMAALSLNRPVLVGWSMGGWLVGDYLRVYGDQDLAGVVLVGSAMVAAPELTATRRPEARATGAYSMDQPTELEAVIAFVKACTAAPLSKKDLALMVGFNMLVPPQIRAAARQRAEDYRPELAALSCPALIVQGAAERICTQPMFEATCAALPQARTEVIPGAGHAPFWEKPETFDAALADFAETAFAAQP